MYPHCKHFQITSEIDFKSCCINCGLVQDNPSSFEYIRTITHYKLLLKEKSRVPPINSIVGEKLREQVINYQKRQQRNQEQQLIKTQNLRQNICFTSPWLGINDLKSMQMYFEYLDFLNKNQNIILPKKKDRKRELIKIYGEHRRFVIEWIDLFSKVIYCI